ncbi:MAG: response regulator [Candidatus Aminicenantes bacterium]|nr:MAG: response regulator [Candidatus Aminicenantes bacterium]RLE04724.1 MAG: response regulator [Candidatus Aminicenantes bacterium]HDJ23517.1 response regulator [Candidatus Aminicenantes bacterium]
MKFKILIVEDESIVALDIASLVKEMGYEVCGLVYSGEEALKVAERTSPDIILLDIGLPGEVDGLTVAEQLKEKHQVAIVFLTGYTDETIETRLRSLQPLGILTKPVDDIAMKEILTKYNQAKIKI